MLMLLLLLTCSDISQAWSDPSIDDITSMKETMKSLLQLDTSDGESVYICLCCHLIDINVKKLLNLKHSVSLASKTA